MLTDRELAMFDTDARMYTKTNRFASSRAENAGT
jgi:hypothetical protein